METTRVKRLWLMILAASVCLVAALALSACGGDAQESSEAAVDDASSTSLTSAAVEEPALVILNLTATEGSNTTVRDYTRDDHGNATAIDSTYTLAESSADTGESLESQRFEYDDYGLPTRMSETLSGTGEDALYEATVSTTESTKDGNQLFTSEYRYTELGNNQYPRTRTDTVELSPDGVLVNYERVITVAIDETRDYTTDENFSFDELGRVVSHTLVSYTGDDPSATDIATTETTVSYSSTSPAMATGDKITITGYNADPLELTATVDGEQITLATADGSTTLAYLVSSVENPSLITAAWGPAALMQSFLSSTE